MARLGLLRQEHGFKDATPLMGSHQCYLGGMSGSSGLKFCIKGKGSWERHLNCFTTCGNNCPGLLYNQDNKGVLMSGITPFGLQG